MTLHAAALALFLLAQSQEPQIVLDAEKAWAGADALWPLAISESPAIRDDAIRKEMQDADIVVLLLSNAFFASRYIKGVELKEALKRRTAGEVEIIPVLLEDTGGFSAHKWLKDLQAVPVERGKLKPMTGFNPSVNGWNHVQKALRETIAQIVADRRK